MKISIELFSHQCVVTSEGFNKGFFVGDNPVKSLENARLAVKALGYPSMNQAQKQGACDTVNHDDFSDMEFVSINGGPLIPIDDFHVDRNCLDTALKELFFYPIDNNLTT